MAALHDLEVKAADVLNTYVMVLNKEKIWTELSPAFWDDAGKSTVKAKALYSLKGAGASFRAHLAHCIKDLDYQSSDADPDL